MVDEKEVPGNPEGEPAAGQADEGPPEPDLTEVAPRYEYIPGIYLTPRVQEIPRYEKAAIQLAIGSDWVSMGAMMFLLVMTFIDVIMRALFKMPFSGTYDWTRYLMVLIATFGMPICTMNDEHVSIDILVRRFPGGLQKALSWLCYGIVVFVLVIYISQGWVQGAFNATIGQTSIGVPWPTYPFYYFIAIGFACMLGIVCIKIINLARGVK